MHFLGLCSNNYLVFLQVKLLKIQYLTFFLFLVTKNSNTKREENIDTLESLCLNYVS